MAKKIGYTQMIIDFEKRLSRIEEELGIDPDAAEDTGSEDNGDEDETGADTSGSGTSSTSYVE